MTRKHFKAIADALDASKPMHELIVIGDAYNSRLYQWRQDVLKLADTLALFNAHFDQDRFLTACGLSE